MSAGPLEGIVVLDLSQDWSGPHTGRLLADFGATVIKIEYPFRIDKQRGGYTENRRYDKHPRFWQLNRGKRSMALDLKNPRDRSVFEDLVRRSDVVVLNSRPGVLDRLGFGYPVLKSLREDIILLAMSAYGQDGPWSPYPAYGGAMEAVGGIQSLTAYTHSGPPRRLREMDVIIGMMGACAVMTALVQRQQTGRGACIDMSETEAASFALIGEHVMEQLINGEHTLPLGNRDPEHAPQGCYPCRGEDRWVAVSVQSDDAWKGLCSVLGREDWARDAALAQAAGRRARHDELDEGIAAWTRDRDEREVMERLQAAGVAAGIAHDVESLYQDPHLAARGFFMKAEDGSGHEFPGVPFRLSKGGAAIRRSGPALGADNEPIAREWLGRAPEDIPIYSEDEIGTDFDVDR